MNPRIAPMKENDLPKRETSFWRMTGPGAIMVGMSIGSGELVMWPWITAKFGAQMVWVALLGVFLQLWINIEVGRWAVASGESAMTGFARVSRKVIFFFIATMFVGAFLPGWARATGTALKHLIYGLEGPGADWMWTALIFVIIALVLFGPKEVYTAVERSVAAMVIIIVVGMVFVAFKVGTAADVGTLAKGAVNFGHITLDDDFTFMRLFGAFVFAGAGGMGNLYYAYYLRDKGIGMGARLPALKSPLRDTEHRQTEIGFIYKETDENRRRFKDWLKYVILDNTCFFWLLNSITMLLFMFGALVVLHGSGVVPEEKTLIWDLSEMLGSEDAMGTFGRYLFLIIAMAAMFSTQIAGVDGGMRIWTDMLHTNFAFTRRFAVNRMYLGLAIFFMCLGVLSVWFFETHDISVLDFFFISAVIAGFSMAVYVPLLLYMNLKFLPKTARPKPLNIVMMIIASVVYISFAFYTIYDKVSSFFS